jgi:hypothetical protein
MVQLAKRSESWKLIISLGPPEQNAVPRAPVPGSHETDPFMSVEFLLKCVPYNLHITTRAFEALQARGMADRQPDGSWAAQKHLGVAMPKPE